MSEELNQLMLKIKDEVSSVVEQHLLPYFERMKTNNENIRLIESVLRQMPDFQRLEKENAELKEALANKVIPPQPQAPQPQAPQPIAPGPVQIVENIIKLEIVETTRSETSEVLESDLYKVVSLANNMVNVQVGKEEEESEEEEEAEEEASEAEEEEESEEEASEAEEAEEEEAEEAEAEEKEAEEEEEAEASEAEEAEASEAEEEEEAEEASEEEEEEAEPLEEEDEAEPLAEPLEDTIQDTGVEGGDPLEEEVTIIDIKDHGKFYTSNPVNGDIYKIDTDEEVGEQVGKFVNSFPIFF